MDRYKVLEEWPPGAFGVTCLVEEPVSQRQFAVKKVECIDERECNLALEEALSLLELQHPNICPYKEFFMVWDNKSSSLFFCMVMDYCGQDNLADIVQLNRREQKKIEDKILQRFLAQVLDALFYIHQKDLPHRNLKPSNIYVKNKDTFVISDFLQGTLVTDEAKAKIRVDPEQKVFMAPESVYFIYSEKSDIWSLGCILLDLMTTSVKSDRDITDLLQMVKVNSSCLGTVFEALQGVAGYTEDLYCLVQKMLKNLPEERSSAKDLVSEPYIKKCLAMVGSPLSGVKKMLPPSVLDQLEDNNLESILKFMQNHIEFEEAQLSALRLLAGYTKDGLQGEIVQIVSQAMTTHRDSYNVQFEGIRILCHLLSQGREQGDIKGYLTSDHFINMLVETVRLFSHEAELLSEILGLMMMLAVSEIAAEMLAKAGFLPDLLKITEQSLVNRELCVSCCALLWSLAMTEMASGDSVKRAVPLISSLIQKHPSDGQLVESASPVLWILCLKGHVTEDQIEPVTLLLLECLHRHMERPVLAKNVCLALTGLVINSELAAYRVLVPLSGKSGLSLIRDLYLLHSDDPEIVENICQLLHETANYGSTHSGLRSQHMEELLREIKDQYESVEEIVTLAESTLSRIEN
ncbi:PREDICTED: serine/threonine kinase-like domain-containing protein STKLD1 [Nanorana parkeri]|uniref:serine/threonine kinase-like domain-containing protein STKLD1 n=1 Tax=Nanorana parkeri TaxID=125878 RepID=UPI000854FCDD|nr:PREDICTED: serine/threonine kinase-like domain-containing protein STKLD1 [Nanorana parkeri]